ncbi:MAG: MBL fold metallo-hydrolase RNA specificity domain-containing protein, partial [Verrucomicrobiota bacterium]
MLATEIAIQPRKAGIFLPEAELWLDPHGRQPRAFISHAHADHYSRPDTAICSPETAHLLHRRFGLKKDSFEILPFGETRRFGDFELTLHPAGHVVGSAMLHLRRRGDGSTLLFTGDFKTKATRTCPAAEAVKADTLILETTYGRPGYVFPPREKVEAAMLRFVEGAFDTGEVPIFCAYSLGKAQELSALLGEHGIAFQAHPSVLEMNTACREVGIALPEAEPIDSPIPERHALICPPNAVRSTKIRRLKHKLTAMVSGWGIHPNARYRYQVDEVFPLSDHADYRELLDFVETVDPSRIHTIHGSTREFAADLRATGRDAWSLFTDDQLELFAQSRPQPPAPNTEAVVDRPLAALNETLNTIAERPSRIAKREGLAELIARLGDHDLTRLVDWLSERSLKLGFGFASIRLALLEAFGIRLADYRAISDQQQDAARTARILSGLYGQPDERSFTFDELATLIDDLRETRVPLDSIRRLAALLRHLPPAEVEFLIRVLTREFRIGSREGLLEEAIAEAFDAKPREIAAAHMLSGDLGQTALRAKNGTLHEAKLVIGTPLKVMLASPAPDAATIWDKLASDAEVWLEDKFDGIRAQLHKRGDEVHLFSRDQRPLDSEFPELLKAARELPDCLLDGEIIAFEEGRKLSFFDLQKRLGKKQKQRGQTDLFHPQEIPVRFIAFDLLAHYGDSLWERPLRERRT